MNFLDKYELLLKAYNNAYAKYSNFRVGAVIILKDERYFLGCNVENASYGLTNCAERTALFSAYANGAKKEDIEELLLITRSKNFTYPCGACRQVIIELMDMDATITLVNLEKKSKSIKVKDLLPNVFSEEDLHE